MKVCEQIDAAAAAFRNEFGCDPTRVRLTTQEFHQLGFELVGKQVLGTKPKTTPRPQRYRGIEIVIDEAASPPTVE